jgi:2-succinyl-5-enolpyruvyl-6-hydroxy-3-cyclohexene-1-carboxylate synthase
MGHTENLTRYIAAFVQSLYQAGVNDVVISPGSRSTPLALTCAEHPEIDHWINLDERSAAFFALGIAKERKRPVALICTSGTAAANYFPAIIEANLSRVPLIVLTADRPHELRDVGAPQAIEQIKLFGDYVKWFHELALPEASEQMLQYAGNTAFRAVKESMHGNQGPVHVNVPVREPLVPDFSLEGIWNGRSRTSTSIVGNRSIDKSDIQVILDQLENLGEGVLVVGPQTDDSLGEVINELATKWNIPILADPLSQLRAGQNGKANIIESYDAILKSSDVKALLQPDFIIRFGAMPVSKAYLQWIQQLNGTSHFIVETEAGHREPSGVGAAFIYADA